MIVEYCAFGSLKDYLVKNRSNFVDQLKVVRQRSSESDLLEMGNKQENDGIRSPERYFFADF